MSKSNIDQNTITGHLTELRSRLIKSLIFIFIIFIYVLLMNKLDKRFYSKESDNKSQLKE